MASNRTGLAVREVEAPPVDLGTGLVEVPAGAVAVVTFHLR
jgi:hypothetical protein